MHPNNGAHTISLTPFRGHVSFQRILAERGPSRTALTLETGSAFGHPSTATATAKNWLVTKRAMRLLISNSSLSPVPVSIRIMSVYSAVPQPRRPSTSPLSSLPPTLLATAGQDGLSQVHGAINASMEPLKCGTVQISLCSRRSLASLQVPTPSLARWPTARAATLAISLPRLAAKPPKPAKQDGE